MTHYATLEQLKAYINTDEEPINPEDDDLLDMFLTNASATIDTRTHRHFEATADTTRKHDAGCVVDGLRLWLNGELAQLTSITNGDGQTIPLTAIITDPNYGSPYWGLTLKRNRGLWWTPGSSDPEDAIAVMGRWAYSVTPPDDIVQATIRLARWYYKQRITNLDLDRAVIVGNTTIAPSQIPADVLTLLRPYIKALR